MDKNDTRKTRYSLVVDQPGNVLLKYLITTIVMAYRFKINMIVLIDNFNQKIIFKYVCLLRLPKPNEFSTINER